MAQTTNDPIGTALADLQNRGAALLQKPGQLVPGNPMAIREQLMGERRGMASNLYGDGISDKPRLNVNLKQPANPQTTGPSPMASGIDPRAAMHLQAAGSPGQLPMAATTQNQLPPAPLQGLHPAAAGPRLQGAGPGLGSQTPGTLPPMVGATYLRR